MRVQKNSPNTNAFLYGTDPMSKTPLLYNHAFDFAFEVESDALAEDVTAKEIRAALLVRIARLSDADLIEAVDCYDTYETQ